MHRTALAACALVAGCLEPGDHATFGVEGVAEVTTAQRGPVIALWEVKSASTPYCFKFGDGVRDGGSFELSWKVEPPGEALNSDGVGVAHFVLLPDGAAVPGDGRVTLGALSVQGHSAQTGVVYKSATAAGPAWSQALGPRFSCVRCVRSQTAGEDSFELEPCANVGLESPSVPRCDW